MPDSRLRAAFPARFLLPCLLLALGLCLSALPRLGPGLERLPSGFRDSGLAMVSLEHGLRWLEGREAAFGALAAFHPASQAQPLPELHPVTLPLYGVARLLGLERERAFQAWLLCLWTLNFLCARLALRRTGLGHAAASVGGLLFALAAATPAAWARPALLHAFPIPLAAACAAVWSGTRSTHAWAGLCAAVVLQWYCCAELGAGLAVALSLAGFGRMALRRGRGEGDFFRAERQAALALAALAAFTPLALSLRDAWQETPAAWALPTLSPWLFAPLAAGLLLRPGLRALDSLLARERPGPLRLGLFLAACLPAALALWPGAPPEASGLAACRARTAEARALLAPVAPGATALALLAPGGMEGGAGRELAVAAMLAAQDLGLPVVNGYAAVMPPGFGCFALQDCAGLTRWLARVQARTSEPVSAGLALAGAIPHEGCPPPPADRASARAWLARSGAEGEPADTAWLLDLRGFTPDGGGAWRMAARGEATLLAGERLTLEWSGGPATVLRVFVDGRSAGRLEAGGGPGRASFSPARETRYAFEVEARAGAAQGMDFSGLAFAPAPGKPAG